MGIGVLLAAITLTTSVAAASTDSVAFIGSEGELRTVAPDGSSGRTYDMGEGLQTIAWREDVGAGAAAGPMIFSWPTWSPDGQRILAFGRRLGGDSTGGLYVFDRATGRIRGALESLSGRPIYAFWSPDSSRAAVLGRHEGGLRLSLWPSATTDGAERVLDAGMPFFWDWRRDSRSLVVHTGDDPEAVAGHSLSLVEVAGRARSVLSREPAEFGAPSWSANGEWLAYAEAVGPRKARLVVARADGSDPVTLIETPNRLALNWSPTAPVLAVAKAGDAGEAHLTELLLFDLAKAGGPRRSAAPDFSIVREPFVAFFWAPTGDRVLLAETSATTTHWHWRVVELDNGQIRDVAEFIPSRPDLNVFRYFDQYALSHRVWSPDGRRFVFTGLSGAELAGAGEASGSRVYVADLDRPGPPRAIADGHTAFWSPR